MDKHLIANLDGYLHSLRRLSGNACDFWAEVFPCGEDVAGGFSKHLARKGVLLTGNYSIGYADIDQILEREVFSRLIVRDDSLWKLFAWDIVEYIQMSYRDSTLGTDPIFSRKSLLFEAQSEFHGEFVYLVIPAGGQAIAVGLATRVQQATTQDQ